MLGRYPVMNTDNLALQQRPNAFDAIGVDGVVPDVLASRVIDRVVEIIAAKVPGLILYY